MAALSGGAKWTKQQTGRRIRSGWPICLLHWSGSPRYCRAYVRSLLEKQNGEKTSTVQTDEAEISADKPLSSSPTLRCSFCGKPDSQVQRMIQGPGVCICDDCVYLCLQVLLVPLD